MSFSSIISACWNVHNRKYSCQNYELLESIVGKIYICTEYCNGILVENDISKRGQKGGKLKISSYQYIVGYERGKGFESCL